MMSDLKLGIGDWCPNIQQAYDSANVTSGPTFLPTRNETGQVQDLLKNEFDSPMIVRRLVSLVFPISGWSGTGGGGGELMGGGQATFEGFLHRANGKRIPMFENPVMNYFPDTLGYGCTDDSGAFAATYARPFWRLAAPFRVKKGQSIYVEFGHVFARWQGSFLTADSISTTAFAFHCVTSDGVPFLWAHSGTVSAGRLRKSFRNTYGQDIFITAFSWLYDDSPGYPMLKVECSSGINWARAEREITPLSSFGDIGIWYCSNMDFSFIPGGGVLLLPGEAFSFKGTIDVTGGAQTGFFMESYVKLD
jgi:hypothetical protein